MTFNIMMDARPMYPDGFHPRDTLLTPDYSRIARHHSRTKRPVKYYLIDFGISVRFEENDPNPTAVPILSADRSVPEFQEDEDSARDPFPTDVYLLGNAIKRDFLLVSLDYLWIHLALAHCFIYRSTPTLSSWNLSSSPWSALIQPAVRLCLTSLRRSRQSSRHCPRGSSVPV